MGDVRYGWSTLPKNKFKFNPELTLGYRTVVDGKNQKYTLKGSEKNFDGGVKEDITAKFSLLTNVGAAKALEQNKVSTKIPKNFFIKKHYQKVLLKPIFKE